jgi:hypothetical protein
MPILLDFHDIYGTIKAIVLHEVYICPTKVVFFNDDKKQESFPLFSWRYELD